MVKGSLGEQWSFSWLPWRIIGFFQVSESRGGNQDSYQPVHLKKANEPESFDETRKLPSDVEHHLLPEFCPVPPGLLPSGAVASSSQCFPRMSQGKYPQCAQQAVPPRRKVRHKIHSIPFRRSAQQSLVGQEKWPLARNGQDPLRFETPWSKLHCIPLIGPGQDLIDLAQTLVG